MARLARPSVRYEPDTGFTACNLYTYDLLRAMGLDVEKHPVPEAEVRAAGLESITNLVVRRTYGPGKSVLLNAHGDVVPPGEGWTHDPYGGEIADGKIYGRAAAVSKCDFSTYAFAVRALEAVVQPKAGTVELLFTYDEEFGGELGPGWLLRHQIIHPDLMIAAGFSYQVITAHNGCLQMEVTVHGKMAHAAIPDTGVDALAVVGEGDDRRSRARALRILDDLGLAAVHDGDAGIGGAEVDTDDFGHRTSFQAAILLAGSGFGPRPCIPSGPPFSAGVRLWLAI